MPDSGCRAGGPLDRAAAEEREAEDVGVAVGARLGGIAGSGLRLCGWRRGFEAEERIELFVDVGSWGWRG